GTVAGGYGACNLVSTVRTQRAASMKRIDRRTEKQVGSLGSSETMVGTRLFPESFRESARRGGPTLTLARRFGQIISREVKFLSQFSVKIFESSRQFGFDSFASLRFLQP